MASRHPGSSRGSVRCAVPPTVSATAPAVDASTAPPHAIISTVGIPNPSYRVGNTSARADEYSAPSDSSGQ